MEKPEWAGLSFEELQALWYDRLKEEGFKDIEEVSLTSRPLKEWHSFKFISETSQVRRTIQIEYQKRADQFVKRSDFLEICQTLVHHGNSTLTAHHIALIFHLHLEGLTERKIAIQLKRSKTCVHLVLERLKQWMNLL